MEISFDSKVVEENERLAAEAKLNTSKTILHSTADQSAILQQQKSIVPDEDEEDEDLFGAGDDKV